jgi:hypothetical protein
MDSIGLQKKPKIRLCNRIQFEGYECFGLYEGFYDSPRKTFHRISLSKKKINSPEQLFATMAHEYCHALQYERGMDLSHTDEVFTTIKSMILIEYAIDIESGITLTD